MKYRDMKGKFNKTIVGVVNDNLCTGCGTCVAMCSHNAITLIINKRKGIFNPIINWEQCDKCGICYSVCPGHGVDFEALNLEVFGRRSEDILIGNYIDCYTGHSTNYDIRYNSTSGGLISELLIFAMEEGMIDGALVTKMKQNSPLVPESFIAKTKTEIIQASKSKYCPVPVNTALREILESESDKKFAVVGLPCHIHALRKAEEINKELKRKIILHIGVVCNHTPSFLATEFLLRKLRVRKEDVKKLDYRGEGWPGGMTIYTKRGDRIFVPYFSVYYWGLMFNIFFFPIRCLLCTDKVCELSDVSFADAWIPQLVESDTLGTSLVISRNKISEEILDKAATKGKIKIRRVSAEKVVACQSLQVVKRRQIARLTLLRTFGYKIPSYYQKFVTPLFLDYFYAFGTFIRTLFSSLYFSRNLIELYVFSIRKLSHFKTCTKRLFGFLS